MDLRIGVVGHQLMQAAVKCAIASALWRLNTPPLLSRRSKALRMEKGSADSDGESFDEEDDD